MKIDTDKVRTVAESVGLFEIYTNTPDWTAHSYFCGRCFEIHRAGFEMK
jgi:hypothetical protein